MQQISITQGILVLVGDKKLEVISCISSSKIQARDIVSGEMVLISPGEIDCELKRTSYFSTHDTSQSEEKPIDEEVAEVDAQLALDRFKVLCPMAGKRFLSKDDMEQCTAALGVSSAQVYRLLARLDMSVGAMSLLPGRRGRQKGVRLLGADAEGIISETINECYEGPGATYQHIIEKVQQRCQSKSIQSPSAGTITSRIRDHKPRALLAKKSGMKAARQVYEVRGEKIQPEAPLELVQIDHCKVDCIIVDSEQREPLIRPWVTMATDVYTRVILGFYLSLSYPSAMSVALCISHSILPKQRWLKQYGMPDVEYPFYGVPKRIHLDNAKEFRSKNLADSCRRYGIELTFRPKATPHNGAHIERVFGTLMGKVHLLPGTTMSSTQEKSNYKSEKHAALSFSEFREWFIREVEIYHKTTHSSINCSPLYKWESYFEEKAGGVSYPSIIDDQLRLLIDFMPVTKRVIGRAGIRLHNIDYYSSTLRAFDIGTKCLVRYDPDSLSKIWIQPAGERAYIELGYADLRLPNTTLSEFKHFRKKLKNESERRVPAADVFDLIRKNDALVSLAKGKQERKNRERKKSRSTDPGHPLNERIPPSDTPVSTDYSRKPQAYDFED